ncbi:Wzz/FepE/Etk N-terminal domain-containing protein [Sulfitobacter dubius]|uniref:Wzz/FepE/Etk N-terminal domain-containing protein n=1 Tax=Sulfitobacter dubius TaxID=218673 RepID=UPI0014288D43|nr:Wzz/FepE/Etk N-terminal domain-containing protein [Sulfitobacter dubius]
MGTTFDLNALFQGVLRHKLLIVATVVAALLIGVLYIKTTPPVFMASTQVMIGDEVAGTSGISNRPANLSQNELTLESALRVLQSQTLALAVVNKLDLHRNDAFMSPPTSLLGEAVQELRSRVPDLLPQAATPESAVDPKTEEMRQRFEAVEILREGVEIRREGRSAVFLIRYSATNRELVAEIVNAYGEAFVSDQLMGNVEASARVLDWLQDRLFVIQDNSTQAALQVEEYRARSGLETVAGEPIIVQMIARLKEDLATATVEVARLRAQSLIFDELQHLDPARFIASGAAGARVPDADFSARQERLLVLQQHLDETMRLYGPDHAEVLQLRERIEVEGRILQREMQRLYETTLNALRAQEAEITMLSNSIEEISRENVKLATSRVELRALERQAEIYESLNETYLLRLKDLEQTQTFPVSNVRLLSIADTPQDPIAPRKTMILGLMLLGLLAGAALSLWRERAQRFIRTRDELQDAIGLPFLGYLPQMSLNEIEGATAPEALKKPRRGSNKPRLGFRHVFPVLKDPHSQFTEALRNIRVAVEASAGSQTGYALGIVSIRPGEGKTTSAKNLAALAATTGRSVLLVDADARTSSLSKGWRQSIGMGLYEVLTRRADWEDALRLEVNTGLHFLPFTTSKGTRVTGDMISAPEFRTLIAEAKQRYELTIVDLAPLGPVSDARALIPALDGLVLMLEWGKVSPELLQYILSSDPILHERLIGAALNKTDMKALAKYSKSEPTEELYYAYGDPAS